MKKGVFVAQRPCTLRGRRYRMGDEVEISVPNGWKPEKDPHLGEGGPWGWGGFSSRRLQSLELQACAEALRDSAGF